MIPKASIAVFALVASCAPASKQAVTAPAAAQAVLRLLDITPADGSRVDSSTVIMAQLAYHIPDFDPERRYVVSALFAGAGGGLSSRGSEGAEIQTPFGIVTVRLPLETLRKGPSSEPASPLTGVFFLLRRDSVHSVQDTIRLGDQMRIRTGMSRSSVQAQTRTFFYNGAGPARSLSSDLPAILDEYWTYRSHKALAVAYDSTTRWTYGYAYGFGSREHAIERALEHCRAAAARRQIVAPCRTIAADDQHGEL